MKVLMQELPFFLTDVKEHAQIKQKVLDAINEMGTYSYINSSQKISSSDWQLGPNFPRPYYALVQHIFQEVCANIKNKMDYEDLLEVANYWYQKYSEGDSHTWHIHKNANFSNVYYLNLPKGSAKTTFKIFDREFSVEVKEGQILSFPGAIPHCSKPNESKEPKIIIAFNC